MIDWLPKRLAFLPELPSPSGLSRRRDLRVGQPAFFRAWLTVLALGQAILCLRSPAAVSVGVPARRFRRHNHR